MINSKLVSILKTFSKGEMKEFEKLVISPFFNRGRNYMPFLNELKIFYPRFDNNILTPVYIHNKLFPGKVFNRQIIWNMTSGLLNLAEEFLIHTNMDKNIFDRYRHAADELHDRKLTKLYEQELDTLEKNVKSTSLGEIYFLNNMQLELRKINLFFLEDKQELAADLVFKKGEFLILYFMVVISNVINNIRYNYLLYNTASDFNLTYEFFNNILLDKVINYAKQNNFEYTFVIELYYCLIMTSLMPADIKYFLRAKELFEQYSHKFESREKENLMGVLSNYCVLKINNEEVFFNQMLFEINLLPLKEIDLMRKKELGKVFYIQALRNALLINEIDWAKDYIEKYTPYLKGSYQKSMKTLAEAFLEFSLKNYNKVIEKLSMVKFIDTRDKYYVKSLSSMAYYELGETEHLYYYIDSAKQFVSKNPSLGKLTRENFSSFLNCLKKLLDYKEKRDLFGLERLKDEVITGKSIINRNWLLEKIEAIK